MKELHLYVFGTSVTSGLRILLENVKKNQGI